MDLFYGQEAQCLRPACFQLCGIGLKRAVQEELYTTAMPAYQNQVAWFGRGMALGVSFNLGLMSL